MRAVLLDYGGTLDGDAQHWFDHFVRLYADAEADIPYDVLKDAFYAADAALTAHPEVRSVAVPPLGCGLGGLDWDAVYPMVRAALGDLPQDVVVYTPRGWKP